MRFALSLVVALGTLATRDADACSPRSCVPGSFLPAPGGQLPLNAPGFVWRPTDTLYRTETSTAWDTLRIRRDEEALAYAVHRLPTAEFGRSMFLVTIEDELFEGDELVVTATTSCPRPGLDDARTSFVISAPAALPTHGGQIEASDPAVACHMVPGSPSCSIHAWGIQVDVRHTLDPTLLPWRDILLYETRVDTVPLENPGTVLDYPIGESWQGRSGDALYSVCASRGTPYPLLAPGRHSVRRIVWIPGLEPTWDTNALIADTSCPPEDRIPVNIDRCMLNPVDAGFPDAGEPDATVADAGAGALEPDGCTCLRARREAAALGLLLVLLVRRRR